MVVFKDIVLEVLKFLIAKGTSVVSVYRFLDTGSAIYMSTSSDVTVIDRVEANSALELRLQLFRTDLEVNVAALLLCDHLTCGLDLFSNYSLFIIGSITCQRIIVFLDGRVLYIN